MKIELDFGKLKNAIGLAERITSKHPTLPVLSCLLFQVSKNSLVVKATNLDMGIEISIPAKSDGEGNVAVPAHTFSSVLSHISSTKGPIKLEINENSIKIPSSKLDAAIKTVPADDFPEIPKVIDGSTSTIPSEILIKGLKSVWYSASTSSIKPELASVYVYKKDDQLIFAATDSFRLAEKRVKVQPQVTLGDVLIPFRNIMNITNIIETIGGNAVVKSNKNLLSIDLDGIHVISRVVDGTFPDYKQIIPKEHSTEAVALKEDVINALKISTIFTDQFNQVRFVVDPKGKSFEIRTKNADVGENNAKIDAALTGEKLEINFNCKYISDCFQSIDTDSVSLELGGMNKPMVIRPASGDRTFTYLVMPMNR